MSFERERKREEGEKEIFIRFLFSNFSLLLFHSISQHSTKRSIKRKFFFGKRSVRERERLFFNFKKIND
jgi:hypothetical protein